MIDYDGFERIPRWIFNNLVHYGNCLVDYNNNFLAFEDEKKRLAIILNSNLVVEKVERFYRFSPDGKVIIWVTKERRFQ